MKKLWAALLLMLSMTAGMCLLNMAQAETISVSPRGMTLGDALGQAKEGDTIVLEEGVYDDTRETFPLVIDKPLTIVGQGNVVIESPKMLACLRVTADHVTLQNIEIRFLRTGIYAIGDDMQLLSCRLTLADPVWRTSSCGIWCGGIYRMVLRDCAMTGCSIALAGPPLSETSHLVPCLTGLFEVGEDREYFTSHTIENTTVNGKPLYYAVNQAAVDVPTGMGQIVVCGCGQVQISDADVSDGSMGMVLAYNDHVEMQDSRADRCGVFGIYIAKCGGGRVLRCSANQTNHAIDLRASHDFILEDSSAVNCDQGMFFSHMQNSTMKGCSVTGTGQGYFIAGGEGCTFVDCRASDCQNGFNLQKEGRMLMMDCVIERCTVCGVRLDATPVTFAKNLIKDNWVGVMAYGGVSFDIADNVFSNSGSCPLYLRDIAFSRFYRNDFTGDDPARNEQIGDMAGSVFIDNQL